MIRINEATSEELQALHGIGPKRAEYIVDYRAQVSPIVGTFDLAAATGLSLSAAAKLADDIDWTSRPDRSGWLPLVLVGLAAIFLIYNTFEQIALQSWQPPLSYYNLALALILLGGIAATGDIAIAGILQRPSESTWVFGLALACGLAGFVLMLAMTVMSSFYDLDEATRLAVEESLSFLAFALVIVTLHYYPALVFRAFIDDERIHQLPLMVRLYDFGQASLGAAAIAIVALLDSPSWIDEIFAGWCLVLLSMNALDLASSRSSFEKNLSAESQARLRFCRYRRQDLDWGTSGARIAALAALIVTMLLLAGLLISAMSAGFGSA